MVKNDTVEETVRDVRRQPHKEYSAKDRIQIVVGVF
jgi:hypothetical protein